MTTKQIAYILEVAKTQNLNHAAENLFTSQPTMTYQIKSAEDEIGFQLFERSGKGATLTPAGAQFCATLKTIQDMLNSAIEQGQNFSTKYHDDITIGLPMRSAVYFLPQAITQFSQTSPYVSVTPNFNYLYEMDSFLNGDQDIIFAMEDDVRRIPDIEIHKLFQSRFYLITEKDDVLANKELIRSEDLSGRTLMIGGGSPPKLRNIQQNIIQSVDISYFNSQNHETTLTNVAAHRGVCIAPGFLNDNLGEFAWIPYDSKEIISCVLCTHKSDQRPSLKAFIKILQKIYADNTDFPF